LLLANQKNLFYVGNNKTTHPAQYIFPKGNPNENLSYDLAYVLCMLLWLVWPGAIDADHT